MTRFKKLIVSATAMTALALTAGAANAAGKYDEGASDTEIKIGNTNPYSGPASSYAVIGKSIDAYFKEINDRGGINGRKLNFISLDDGYSPPKTKEQFRRLVEKEKVLFIFQSLGTPTNSAVHKYINRKKVPHLFVATGATKWGDPENYPWTMGYQPNYQTAGKIFGNYVLQNKPNGKIGILYQNDDYGKDYVIGMQLALGDKFDKMVIAQQSYETTDPTVDSQVVNLRASGADVFYNVAIPKFAAQGIKKVHDMGWKPMHLLNDVSASIPSTIKPAGFEKSQGILTAGYMMDPNDPQWKDHEEMVAWRAFMAKYQPKGDLSNLNNVYGWAVAHLMEQVLIQAGDDLTRANIMKQAASVKDFRVPGLLPGINANTSATDFYPLEQMQMQRFEGEGWVRFGEIISAGSGS
jgi:branched-chain amino acid transport system substrate-binding protein